MALTTLRQVRIAALADWWFELPGRSAVRIAQLNALGGPRALEPEHEAPEPDVDAPHQCEGLPPRWTCRAAPVRPSGIYRLVVPSGQYAGTHWMCFGCIRRVHVTMNVPWYTILSFLGLSAAEVLAWRQRKGV